ncbi:hypothetical protein Tco_0875538 [Tanacetum coccineum]|uniref:Uncharacterized protein n=1 Tax=Tanacetum coccineum TaxID=301880 RepID=A0ABQ5BSL1_9ASTR
MDGTPMEINMLVEKKYLLIKELLEKMLNLQFKAKEESTIAFDLIKFIKSMLEETLILRARVEYFQLGIESHQNERNMAKPLIYLPNVNSLEEESLVRESMLLGIVYLKSKYWKHFMMYKDVHKFCTSILKSVKT